MIRNQCCLGVQTEKIRQRRRLTGWRTELRKVVRIRNYPGGGLGYGKTAKNSAWAVQDLILQLLLELEQIEVHYGDALSDALCDSFSKDDDSPFLLERIDSGGNESGIQAN